MITKAIIATITLFLMGDAIASGNQCEALIERLNREPRGKVASESTLDLIERSFGSESYIEVRGRLSVRQVNAHNRSVQKALEEPLPEINTTLALAVTKKQADLVVDSEQHHPVVGGANYSQYDPTGCLGFCFGRATIVHLEAIRRKVHPSALRKIWVVGSMNQRTWDYHVTTIVKAADQSWWSLDSNHGEALPVKEWIALQAKDSDDGKLMVFVSDARRFSPFTPQQYSPMDLLGDGETDFYNHFFRDYLNYTARQPAPEPFRLRP